MNEVFDLIDSDGSGGISLKEVEAFNSCFVEPIEPTTLHGFYTEADTDGDKSISRDEFRMLCRKMQLYASLSSAEMIERFKKHCYAQLFDIVDQDQGGTVTSNELLKLVLLVRTKLRLTVTDEEVRTVRRKCGMENQNDIGRDQFATLVSEITKDVPISHVLHAFSAAQQAAQTQITSAFAEFFKSGGAASFVKKAASPVKPPNREGFLLAEEPTGVPKTPSAAALALGIGRSFPEAGGQAQRPRARSVAAMAAATEGKVLPPPPPVAKVPPPPVAAPKVEVEVGVRVPPPPVKVVPPPQPVVPPPPVMEKVVPPPQGRVPAVVKVTPPTPPTPPAPPVAPVAKVVPQTKTAAPVQRPPAPPVVAVVPPVVAQQQPRSVLAVEIPVSSFEAQFASVVEEPIKDAESCSSEEMGATVAQEHSSPTHAVGAEDEQEAMDEEAAFLESILTPVKRDADVFPHHSPVLVSPETPEHNRSPTSPQFTPSPGPCAVLFVKPIPHLKGRDATERATSWLTACLERFGGVLSMSVVPREGYARVAMESAAVASRAVAASERNELPSYTRNARLQITFLSQSGPHAEGIVEDVPGEVGRDYDHLEVDRGSLSVSPFRAHSSRNLGEALDLLPITPMAHHTVAPAQSPPKSRADVIQPNTMEDTSCGAGLRALVRSLPRGDLCLRPGLDLLLLSHDGMARALPTGVCGLDPCYVLPPWFQGARESIVPPRPQGEPLSPLHPSPRRHNDSAEDLSPRLVLREPFEAALAQHPAGSPHNSTPMKALFFPDDEQHVADEPVEHDGNKNICIAAAIATVVEAATAFEGPFMQIDEAEAPILTTPEKQSGDGRAQKPAEECDVREAIIALRDKRHATRSLLKQQMSDIGDANLFSSVASVVDTSAPPPPPPPPLRYKKRVKPKSADKLASSLKYTKPAYKATENPTLVKGERALEACERGVAATRFAQPKLPRILPGEPGYVPPVGTALPGKAGVAVAVGIEGIVDSVFPGSPTKVLEEARYLSAVERAASPRETIQEHHMVPKPEAVQRGYANEVFSARSTQLSRARSSPTPSCQQTVSERLQNMTQDELLQHLYQQQEFEKGLLREAEARGGGGGDVVTVEEVSAPPPTSVTADGGYLYQSLPHDGRTVDWVRLQHMEERINSQIQQIDRETARHTAPPSPPLIPQGLTPEQQSMWDLEQMTRVIIQNQRREQKRAEETSLLETEVKRLRESRMMEWDARGGSGGSAPQQFF